MFAKEGIRINAICPGYVETNLTTKIVNNGLLDPELERTPMGRVAEIDEIVDCMVFLGSNMSSFMTGATLTVDGYVAIMNPFVGCQNRLSHGTEADFWTEDILHASSSGSLWP